MRRTPKQTGSHSMAGNISPSDTGVNPSEASETTPLRYGAVRTRRHEAVCAVPGSVISASQLGHFTANSAVLGAVPGTALSHSPTASAINAPQLPTCGHLTLLRLQRVSPAAFFEAAVAVGCRRDRQHVGSGGYIFLPHKAPIVHSGQRSVDQAMIRATLLPPALTFE